MCSILKYCSRDCSLELASKQLHNIPSGMLVVIYKLVRIIKQVCIIVPAYTLYGILWSG